MPRRSYTRLMRPFARASIRGMLALMIVCLFALASSSALAATWTGGSLLGDDWSDADNWLGGVAPGNGDTVTYDANSVARLTTGNNDLALTGITIEVVSGVGTPAAVTIGGNAVGLTGIDTGSPRNNPITLTINNDLNLEAGGTIALSSLNLGGSSVVNLNGSLSLGANTLSVTGSHSAVPGGTVSLSFNGGVSGTGGISANGLFSIYANSALSYTGATTLTDACDIQLGAGGSLPSSSAFILVDGGTGGGTIHLNGRSGTVGSVQAGGNRGQIHFTGGSLTMGGNNASTSFGGSIVGPGALIKAGTGTFTLNSSVAGDNLTSLTVNGGSFKNSGSGFLPNTVNLTLGAAGTFDIENQNQAVSTLSGTGTVITATGGIAVDTSLNPGSSPGAINVGIIGLSGALNVEINGLNPGADYDQVRVTLNAAAYLYSGNLNLIPTISPAAGATFTIIDQAGGAAVSGTFAGLPEGSTIIAGGTTYRISYVGGDGNDVVLTSLGPAGGGPTPEPEPEPEPRPAPKVTQGSSPSPAGSLNGPTLSWPHEAGSNFYRVYRAACPTCPKVQVGRVPDASFTDQSALPGQVYYYFIRTENPGGLSDYSDWIPAWRYEQNPGRAGDFNGDGIMDLLWWDPDTGQLSIWYMNGGAVQSVSSPGDGMDPGQWLLVNTGDFNSDGIDDLLWWNPETGVAQIWYLSATASTSSGGMGIKDTNQAGDITGNVTLSYRGDLNGDGRADLVWRDYSTGNMTVWLMGDDGKPQLSGPPTLAPGMTDGGKPGASGSLEWTLRGLRDMNADGKADLVWQHGSDGRAVVWHMDGSQATSLSEYQRGDSTNWRIVGLGDLNGDGWGDLVWRNDASGAVQAWLMTGPDSGVEPAYEQRDIAMGDQAALWQVKAVGDFCAPGYDDVYCKHWESSEAKIVTLDGEEFTPTVE